jgi:hypothetical protein
MKKHQFEEITAALSLLICLAAYSLDIKWLFYIIKWLFYIYAFKAVGDTLSAVYAAAKSLKKEKLKKKIKQLEQELK